MAALAAGVLQPNQLAGISVPAEDTAMSEESEDEDESKQSDEEPAEGENDSDDSESESESESDSDSDSDNDKDNGKNKENVDGGVDPVKLEPQEAPGKGVSADERNGDKEFCGHCRLICAVQLLTCYPYRRRCYVYKQTYAHVHIRSFIWMQMADILAHLTRCDTKQVAR